MIQMIIRILHDYLSSRHCAEVRSFCTRRGEQWSSTAPTLSGGRWTTGYRPAPRGNKSAPDKPVPSLGTPHIAEHVVIPAIQRFALASSHAARDTSGSRRGGTRARGLTILLHAAATAHRRRCTFREHTGRPPPTAARDSFLLYATDLGQRVGWHGHHRTHTAVNAGVTKRWRERTVPSKVPPSVNYLA